MFGSKKRKERKAEELKIAKLKGTVSGSGGGRSGSKRRSDAKKELNRMGHLTDKQKSQKDKKDRQAYDQEHTIKNRRGRTTGYKEGYDPSKGVKGASSSKTAKPKKKMSAIERRNRERFGDAHVDALKAKARNRKKK